MPSVNLYIDSSNKRNGTNSNFSITLSSGLIKCNEDQGLEINLMNLEIQNTMLNIQDGLNNEFKVAIDDVDYKYSIEEGFYNVLQLRDYLNILLSGKIDIWYSKTINKYRYTALNANTSITSINAGQFLGLVDNVTYDLSSPMNSPNHLDMVYRKKIILETNNLQYEKSSIENIGMNESYFEQSSILFWCDKTDIPFNSVISYKNDNSFYYKIFNKEISHIDFRILDENGNEYYDLPNFSLLLQINIYERDNREMALYMSEMNEYIKQIYTVILMIMKFFNII